ncbi:MAG: molybdopterin-dependent oxidoreductase [Xanthomonadales bacterium]|nr:molybdopterin-dependent oxidoreductase [Xanthomonadales bacterium]
MSGSVHTSRRLFLKSGAAVAVALATGGIRLEAYASPSDSDKTREIFAGWVEIRPDNSVHILFPSTEMGQGSETGLPQILADELEADWDQVSIHQLNQDDRRFGNPAFGNVLYTAGSSAIYGYFQVLRQAGATLRDMLRQRVADEWGVDVQALTAAKNRVIHAPSGRSLSYGDIVALPRFSETTLSAPAALKSQDQFTLIGKSVPRRDVPAKSTGTARYAIDVRVPDMVYATVLRAPVEGESIASMDDKATRATRDVMDVVPLPDGVAVLARTMHASFAGRAALNVTWTESSPFRKYSSDDTIAAYRKAAEGDDPGAAWRTEGDADAALSRAARTFEAVYTSDYAYHAQIEPMAAVASVDTDGKGAEIWAGTQTQSWTTRTATEVLGTTPERIRLNMMTMGGGFGRRTELMQNYVRDALLCSRAAKRPVKVVWSRTDDIKFGAFRPAAAQRLRAGVDENGVLKAWHHRVATPSVIEYFNPIRWQQVAPNDIVTMRGAESKFYSIPDFLAEHVKTERQARILPWRGIGAAYTSFAAEAFIDEVAVQAGINPFEFRRAIMRDNPRGTALIDRVENMAAAVPLAEGRARGLAFAGYGDTQSAGIAEISVNESSGTIRVHQVWIAVDAGQIVSPDNAHSQIEGGVLWGVSSALYERVTITAGQVDQNNFNDYAILRNNMSPKIEVHIAENHEKPTQIGEAGNPLVPPAIANAFFALTGRRIRHQPFTPDRVREALA